MEEAYYGAYKWRRLTRGLISGGVLKGKFTVAEYFYAK